MNGDATSDDAMMTVYVRNDVYELTSVGESTNGDVSGERQGSRCIPPFQYRDVVFATNPGTKTEPPHVGGTLALVVVVET